MKTVSTLLISTTLAAALLSGASMAMRSDAAPQVPAQVSRGAEAAAPAQAWSNPPERVTATPALPERQTAQASEVPEPQGVAEPRAVAETRVPDAQPAASKPAIRRVAARTDAPKRAEASRPPRRMAQASLRPRGTVARTAQSAPARPVDPISDFLRGVGLLDDDHG